MEIIYGTNDKKQGELLQESENKIPIERSREKDGKKEKVYCHL